jgi:anti-anti-sigma factor
MSTTPNGEAWTREHLSAENLTVLSASRDGDLIIDLRGEVDDVSAPHLWSCLEIELGQGPPRVVLDLSKVSFLSSAGVTVIIRLLRQLSASGGDLVIKSPSATAQRVLDVTGLASRITVEE